MKKTLIISLIILISTGSFAQNDSLRHEILNYTGVKTEIIQKGRALLAEKLKEGDLKKVAEIKAFLEQEIPADDYIVFYPLENWYLLYWTGDFEELLKQIWRGDFEMRSSVKRITPPADMLLTGLQAKTMNSLEQLKDALLGANLSAEDRDFLLLHLAYITTTERKDIFGHDALNEMAADFLEKHPKSEYDDFVRRYIRYDFRTSKWGYGFDFFTGYGFLTEQLGDMFTGPIPMGVSFDINYSKWIMYLRIYIGLHKTAQNLPFDGGEWEKGSQSRLYMPEITLGYSILENKLMRVAPFAGISWLNFAATEHDINKKPELEDAGLKGTSALTFGLNTDFKLGKPQSSQFYNGTEESYWLLKFRYTYHMPRLEQRYGITGNLHSLTLGIGGFGRMIKRKY